MTPYAPSITYLGNGVTSVFPVPFPLNDPADLQVTVIDESVSPGVATILQPADYTVAGIGSAAGASVTYPLSGAALSGTRAIVIRRLDTYPAELAPSASPGTVDYTLEYMGDQARLALMAAGKAAAANAASAASSTLSAANAASAASSALSAANAAAALTATSATAQVISSGLKTFVTQAGKQFVPGSFILAVDPANPDNFMVGRVTSYADTILTLDVTASGGSGSVANCQLSVTGVPAAQGLAAVATSGSASDLITGTLPAERLPTPTASALGGVKTSAAGSHQFATGIDASGAVTYAQPAAADVSGLGELATASHGSGLGLSGGSLSVTFGSVAGTAAAGNDSRIVGALQAASNLADLGNPAAARGALGLGSAALATLGTGAGQVPTADQVAGLVGPITDTTARDQLALSNLRLMLNSSVGSGALVQGKQWKLDTDEWAAGSSGYAFTAGSPGVYASQGYGQSVFTGGTASAASVYPGENPAAVFDGNINTTCGSNTNNYGQWTYDLGTGVTKTVSKIMIACSGGADNQCVDGFTFAGSNDGTNWATLYTAPNGSGTTNFGTGAAVVSTYFTFANTTAYRYYQLSVTQTGVPTSRSIARVYELSGYENIGGNLTLVSPAVPLSTAPAYADSYFLWKDDSGSAVLGTDLTVELSRDGGTTWTAATLTNLLGDGGFDGTYTMVKARANLSGQPSGTALSCRIRTFNTKAQRVAAPALYAE